MSIPLLSSFGFWFVLGLLLLVAEFVVPGVIILFFGFGALAVGLLTWMGILEGLAAQVLWFSLISLGCLFGLRNHFQRWFMGAESNRAQGDLDNSGILGARVQVISDFAEGAGAVHLNGAKWDAESDEPLRAGDTAWVIRHDGIVLRVSQQRPGKSPD